MQADYPLAAAIVALFAACLWLGVKTRDRFAHGRSARMMHWRVMALLLALGLLSGWAVTRVFTRERPAPDADVVASREDWRLTGNGLTQDLSGLALFPLPDGTMSFLAVHDNKGAVSEPRFSLLTARDGEVFVRALVWPGSEPPIDLEAITAVPGRTQTFAALTSKGRLYTVQLDAAGRQLRVLEERDVPNAGPAMEFEALDLAHFGEQAFAFWGERGSAETPGRLFWSTIDLRSMVIDPARLKSTELRVPWPAVATRHIADFELDPTGALILAATTDPGDAGPFASAIYLAGSFRAREGDVAFVANSEPTRLHVTLRHKIEALALWPGARGGLVLGSDDESFGGTLLLPEGMIER